MRRELLAALVVTAATGLALAAEPVVQETRENGISVIRIKADGAERARALLPAAPSPPRLSSRRSGLAGSVVRPMRWWQRPRTTQAECDPRTWNN